MATQNSPVIPVIVGANLGETAVDSGYDWNNERRTAGVTQIFQWTRHGCGYFEGSGKVIPVPEDHAMILSTPEPSRYYHGGAGHAPWTFNWLTTEGLERLWHELRERFGSVVRLPAGSVSTGLMEEIVRLHLQHGFVDRYHVAELLHRFAISLMRDLERRTMDSAGPIEQGRLLIEELFARPITIKESASRIGVSREHFIREYTGAYGIGPGSRLRDLRLDQARRLLQSTSCTCADAARQSGFSSAVHFSRAFRKRFGVTPAESRSVRMHQATGGAGARRR